MILKTFFATAIITLLAGCANGPEKSAADETNVISERCFATGSNLPRRDCREVKSVDPSRVEMPSGGPTPRVGTP